MGDFFNLRSRGLALALVIIASLQLATVWTISSYFFPGYDSVSQSLSELAADDSPVRWVVRGSLIVQAGIILLLASYAKLIAPTGRIFLTLAAIFLILSALVPSPSQTVFSVTHRMFSFLAFAFSCLWPAFASSATFTGIFSKIRGFQISLIFALLTLASWWVWAFASETFFGAMQRVNILLQSMVLAWALKQSFKKKTVSEGIQATL